MGIKITGNAPEQEMQAYVDYLEKKYNRKLKSLEVTIDFEPAPFERIRRITGYLVGSMDHWNNAKAAEEADRVKHSVSSGLEQL